jgi:hypothetical protein
VCSSSYGETTHRSAPTGCGPRTLRLKATRKKGRRRRLGKRREELTSPSRARRYRKRRRGPGGGRTEGKAEGGDWSAARGSSEVGEGEGLVRWGVAVKVNEFRVPFHAHQYNSFPSSPAPTPVARAERDGKKASPCSSAIKLLHPVVVLVALGWRPHVRPLHALPPPRTTARQGRARSFR